MKTSLFAGRFVALVREEHWEYAERVHGTGAVALVAVTDENKLLLVEQYRIPCHARTIELPAGIIGDEPQASQETQVETARRELLEETGYAAEHLEALVTGPTSSGLASELVTLLRATGLRKAGAGGGVAHEEITVHEVPIADVRRWLAEKIKAGILVDPKVYAGLYFIP